METISDRSNGTGGSLYKFHTRPVVVCRKYLWKVNCFFPAGVSSISHRGIAEWSLRELREDYAVIDCALDIRTKPRKPQRVSLIVYYGRLAIRERRYYDCFFFASRGEVRSYIDAKGHLPEETDAMENNEIVVREGGNRGAAQSRQRTRTWNEILSNCVENKKRQNAESRETW